MSNSPTKMGAGPFVMVAMLPLLLLAYQFQIGAGDYGADVGSSDPPVRRGATNASLQDSSVQTLPGFEVQRIYDVPLDDYGSWVALAVGPEGNLIASDQQHEGLFRVIIRGDIDHPEVEIEEIAMPASGAQGLLWGFDHLYANVNGVGLFRLSDTGGKAGQFNMMEYVEESPDGGGEHGNHAVIPTADGDGLYIVNGNHTPLPESYTRRVASWDEDLLLPRNWDARGHARGILAPGGYIARINPGGTQWEIVSMGYRNTYDIAVNPQGEVFAYDADMEWDMGMPWYRPTRIVHSVSGSDYGWRSGSGKWKTYYEDSLPPTLNIGPGSPTGLLFGTGAKFPARYQRALFALDWTFGTIRAVHLTPEGGSYRAEAEEFVSGSPLPLTDAVIGADGHLYFATGGRGTESHLYRVVYRGDESTAPVEPVDHPQAHQAREKRHQLEAFHGRQDPQAVEMAWPYLDSEDRFLRYAARVAVEWQPVDSWAQRALNENRSQARITALVALARSDSNGTYRDEAIASLMEMNPADLSADHKLGYLRAMSLVFMRLGDPNERQRTQITDTLQRLLPSEDARVNTELIRVLVYLEDARVIEKALALMRRDTEPPVPGWDSTLIARNERYGGTINDMIENPPPTNKLEYAYMLRNLRNGWTIEQRRAYFTFINEASDALGGASYTGFLERMRDEALRNASEEEIAAVSDLTGISLAQEPDFEITPPEGPGREWTVEAGEEALFGDQQGRGRSIRRPLNYERGRSLFHAIGCASCHRFDGYGGNIGPDLNTVARRFDADEMLEDIIHPSLIISDQYSSSEVTLDNGDTITGVVVERSDSVEVYTRDPDAPPTVVNSSRVVSVGPVDVSQMPPGLINTLNPQELRDLMAYLVSGGDSEAEVYVGTDEDDEDAEEEQEGD